MKVFKIRNNIVHWDATSVFPTVAATVGRFPPSDLFVEAPDNVFEGWGYDPTKEGDERFIQPTPPEGWLYDEATGTFYPEGEMPSVNETEPTELEQLRADVDFIAVMTGVELI